MRIRAPERGDAHTGDVGNREPTLRCRRKKGVAMGSAHHKKSEAKKAAVQARKQGLSAEVVEQKQVRFRWRVDTKRK